jgi:hypothetical protein
MVRYLPPSSAVMRDLPRFRVPSAGALLPHSLFRYLLDLEIDKANRLRYCVSLVCLTPDVETPESDPGLARAIAQMALRQLRSTDVATTLPRDVIALLLIDTDPRVLDRVLDRAANARVLEGRRFVRGRQVVSVSAGASCYPLSTSDRTGLLREASQLMHRARRDGGDRLILPPLPASSAN